MKIRRGGARGQGLVEYALIVALVAVVAVIILAWVGSAVSRVNGVICGALGCKHLVDTDSQSYLAFDPNQEPTCGYVSMGNGVYLTAQFWARMPRGEFTVSTDTGFLEDADIRAGMAYQYNITKLIAAGSSDTSGCPHSIVLQSSPAAGNLTAVHPVRIGN